MSMGKIKMTLQNVSPADTQQRCTSVLPFWQPSVQLQDQAELRKEGLVLWQGRNRSSITVAHMSNRKTMGPTQGLQGREEARQVLLEVRLGV